MYIVHSSGRLVLGMDKWRGGNRQSMRHSLTTDLKD